MTWNHLVQDESGSARVRSR